MNTLTFLDQTYNEHTFKLQMLNGRSTTIMVTDEECQAERLMPKDLAMRIATEYLEYAKLEPTVIYKELQ